MNRTSFSRLQLIDRFTLLELLIVIAIIGILATLLMPSLQSALSSARKAHCTNNLRQLCAATIAYNDDQRALPSDTYFSYLYYGGPFQNSHLQAWYSSYVGGRPCPEAAYAGNVGMAMRFYTNEVCLCPSLDPAPLATGADRALGRIYDLGLGLPYGLFTFGALDRPVSINKATAAFLANKPRALGSSPALWADRANLLSGGNNGGGFVRTNHKAVWIDDTSGIPEGGNVGHVDGHVKWFPYVGNYSVEDSYVINGAIVGTHMAIPASACYPNCTTGGVLNTTKPYWIFGRGFANMN